MGHTTTIYNILDGFGELDVELTKADSERLIHSVELSTHIRFGLTTSFTETGKQLAEHFTFNRI